MGRPAVFIKYQSIFIFFLAEKSLDYCGNSKKSVPYSNFWEKYNIYIYIHTQSRVDVDCRCHSNYIMHTTSYYYIYISYHLSLPTWLNWATQLTQSCLQLSKLSCRDCFNQCIWEIWAIGFVCNFLFFFYKKCMLL